VVHSSFCDGDLESFVMQRSARELPKISTMVYTASGQSKGRRSSIAGLLRRRVHPACISNDPSFDLNPELGKSINYDCFRPQVRASKDAGVKRFVFRLGARRSRAATAALVANLLMNRHSRTTDSLRIGTAGRQTAHPFANWLRFGDSARDRKN